MTDHKISAPVTLFEPIQQGDTQITAVRVRKPYGGEMRGLEIGAIIRGSYDQTVTLLTRVTLPPLTDHEIRALDPADVAELSGTVTGFFLGQGRPAPAPATSSSDSIQ